jgi:hypothetical protein
MLKKRQRAFAQGFKLMEHNIEQRQVQVDAMPILRWAFAGVARDQPRALRQVFNNRR